MSDASPETASLRLAGERGARPRSTLAHVLLSVSLISPSLALAKLAARHLLGWRRPLSLEFSRGGISLHQRTELFGRTVTESQSWLPRENLACVAREARFSRAGLYLGLLCLLLGSFSGISLLLEAARTSGGGGLASKGLLMLAGGCAIDFALNGAPSSRRAHCRVVVSPRQGAPFSCERLEPSTADAALRAFAASEQSPGAQG